MSTTLLPADFPDLASSAEDLGYPSPAGPNPAGAWTYEGPDWPRISPTREDGTRTVQFTQGGEVYVVEVSELLSTPAACADDSPHPIPAVVPGVARCVTDQWGERWSWAFPKQTMPNAPTPQGWGTEGLIRDTTLQESHDVPGRHPPPCDRYCEVHDDVEGWCYPVSPWSTALACGPGPDQPPIGACAWAVETGLVPDGGAGWVAWPPPCEDAARIAEALYAYEDPTRLPPDPEPPGAPEPEPEGPSQPWPERCWLGKDPQGHDIWDRDCLIEEGVLPGPGGEPDPDDDPDPVPGGPVPAPIQLPRWWPAAALGLLLVLGERT